MDTKTAEILNKLNADFYRDQCESFSATRAAPWAGWAQALDAIKQAELDASTKLSVLDLACGNLRFWEFLTEALPEVAITFYAVDSCANLLPKDADPSVRYQDLDVVAALQEGLSINEQLNLPLCDLSVSFGFMHHIPLPHHREQVLHSLIKQTRPGGYVVVSFWQFLNNEALKEKAYVTHERALKELGLPQLNENDFILGWNNVPDAYRYCHSFSEEEIDHLVKQVADEVSLVSLFVADGRTSNLNTYLILQRR